MTLRHLINHISQLQLSWPSSLASRYYHLSLSITSPSHPSTHTCRHNPHSLSHPAISSHSLATRYIRHSSTLSTLARLYPTTSCAALHCTAYHHPPPSSLARRPCNLPCRLTLSQHRAASPEACLPATYPGPLPIPSNSITKLLGPRCLTVEASHSLQLPPSAHRPPLPNDRALRILDSPHRLHTVYMQNHLTSNLYPHLSW